MSSRSTSLEPKSRFTINLALRRKQKRKELPNQKSGRKQKEKIPQSKNGRKQKHKKGKKIPDQGSEENRRNMQKGILTRRCLNNADLSPRKHKKKGNHDLKWSSLFDCQPKSCASVTCSPRPKQKIEKEKAKNIQSQNPTKTPFPRKSPTDPWSHVVFDLIGNNLQNQVIAYLWFGIRMKHLPVWDWYTLSDFLLFLLNPVFPLNGHLETKC